jgi:phage terminase Nu1 subunit (DNA packaging protein)
MENLSREEEARRIDREKQEARLEIARIELAEDQKKITRLKKHSGNQPTGSPTSS